MPDPASLRTRSTDTLAHMGDRLRVKVVSAVAFVAVAATGLVIACGSDEGGGEPSCAGTGCDGGSNESSRTPDGSQPQPDASQPRDGGRDADTSVVETCGDGGAPGTLDESFGDGGMVWLKYPGSGANSVAVQADGKIVLGGYIGGAQGGAAIVRLLPNGSLDATFGSNGLVVSYVEKNYSTTAIALQTDGRIVAAGPCNDLAISNIAVRRHLTDGGTDPSFGDGGVVVTSYFGREPIPRSVVIQPDGKILVSGESSAPTAGSGDYEVVRYKADGSLDATFGSGGRVTVDVRGTRDTPGVIALASDGKIIVAGRSSLTLDDPDHTDMSAVRLDSSGALDPTFGNGGKFITSFGGLEAAASVVFDATGRIVVGGQHGTAPDFGLFRLTAAGALDPSFGDGGAVSNDFGDTFEGASTVLLQEDGKLLANGSSSTGAGASRIASVRYLPNGAVDPTFGTGGQSLMPPPPNAQLRAAAAALNGCTFVTVGGWFYDENTASKSAMGIARYRR